MTRKLLLFVGCFMFYFINAKAQLQSDEIFDTSKLHEIKIEFEEENFWDILTYNYESAMGGNKSAQKNFRSAEEFFAHMQAQKISKSESKIEYLAGKVIFDGDIINDVGVRLKGFSSYWTEGVKKSIKLDFNEFVDTQEYKGIKKINLNNGVGDPSFQRDFMSYYMMRQAGVAAPRVSYAKVYINDVYWGLYTMVEQVDKTFLQNNFASGSGNLFKAIGWSQLEYINDNFKSYNESIELKTNEEKSDGSDYVNFVKSLQYLNGSAFDDSIQKLFYVDYFFKVLAIDIISKNWDSYMEHGRNFYLYHEPVSDLFYWIPWDYNLAWGGDFSWGGSGGSGWENPCDTNCNFTYDTVGYNIAYKIELNIDQLNYAEINIGEDWRSWWDFSGDDTTITITDSTVVIIDTMQIDDPGVYSINVYASYNNDCFISRNERVVTIDSSEIKCPSIYTMAQAYNTGDVIFNEVFRMDNYCCDCQWDGLCQDMYFTYPDTSVNSNRFPIDFYTEKHMLQKLLKNNDFKNQYFNIFKYILDSVFNDEHLISLINTNTDLIREAVYADTNLIFSIDEFENDIATVCDKSFQITSLTRLIENRKSGLDTEYKSLSYTAQPLQKTVNKNDVVINEFMTSRSDADTTYKSDWIELYNNTDNIIELDGFWLSDRRDSLKFKFPKSAVIKPDGYVIVWADNKNKKNGLHSGFKLSAGGEDILLYHEKYDTIDVIGYEYVYEDSVLARIPNGSGDFVIMYPTFNRNNESGRLVDIKSAKEFKTLVAYPNPANNTLIMQTTNDDKFEVEIYDTMGKLIGSKTGFGKQISVNVADVPDGLYILKVNHGAEHYSSKIIIEH